MAFRAVGTVNRKMLGLMAKKMRGPLYFDISANPDPKPNANVKGQLAKRQTRNLIVEKCFEPPFLMVRPRPQFGLYVPLFGIYEYIPCHTLYTYIHTYV